MSSSTPVPGDGAPHTEALAPAPTSHSTARPATADEAARADPSAPSSVSQYTLDPSATEKTRTSPTSSSHGLPPLPYNLREHKLTITGFWFLIFTECTLIPIVFYFTISRLTDMRAGAMFAIITAMFGFISGGEYGLRGVRLAWKDSPYRPLKGGQRWHFDSTHLILGNPYFVMTALMIGFSIPEPPKIRGLSIIMPVGIIMVVLYMMYTGVAYHFGWRLRWHRLSSHVIGDITPPLTFCIMEDITACDGGGGREYREAALARFNASPRFRRMLVQMLWAWSISGLLMSIGLIVLAWTIHEEVAYALGWAVPSVWGGIGAFLTIKWGQRCLRIEKERWAQDQTEHIRHG
ncbi:hypothetical protein S40285_00071 [Stachybotrys chlorohalonatus IBT 40285]|uniref:Uncharacterized protein n=1 Tax=Stachybotrys chlorohalonatus (strain IBT 40285) TaxID=1283841 RepID=A0A084QYY8_STAC4|nr:hypothetical protein S40285_00071 [Stachybotrys chlorohalonata IBT 40285]